MANMSIKSKEKDNKESKTHIIWFGGTFSLGLPKPKPDNAMPR